MDFNAVNVTVSWLLSRICLDFVLAAWPYHIMKTLCNRVSFLVDVLKQIKTKINCFIMICLYFFTRNRDLIICDQCICN
jgi:hypothetical protein